MLSADSALDCARRAISSTACETCCIAWFAFTAEPLMSSPAWRTRALSSAIVRMAAESFSAMSSMERLSSPISSFFAEAAGSMSMAKLPPAICSTWPLMRAMAAWSGLLAAKPASAMSTSTTTVTRPSFTAMPKMAAWMSAAGRPVNAMPTIVPSSFFSGR